MFSGGLVLSDNMKDLIAGTLAGVGGKIVEHPLDTVKTRLQDIHSTYSGVVDCLRKTVKSEGFCGLFRGVTPPLLASASEAALLFAGYNRALAALASTTTGASATAVPTLDEEAALPMWMHAVAGAAGGAVAAQMITPAEMLKCRMQAATHSSLSTRRSGEVLREFFRQRGWYKKLFQGHTATLAREVPGTMAWFVFYELTNKLQLHRKAMIAADPTVRLSKNDLSSWELGLSGGIAGVMYWSTFFPADVVKTRMQLCDKFSKGGLCKGLVNIYRQEGLRGLYRGYGCTIVRAFPAHACVFVTYENVMQQLRHLSKEV